MPRINLVPARELTPELEDSWSAIASEKVYLDSPFLQPAFTRAVAQVRDDVEVAVIEDDGAIRGFFPFQRGPRGLMRNVCSRLSEFHTPVVRPAFPYDPAQLLVACDLTHWHFDHMPANSPILSQRKWGQSVSPLMDLRNGYENYIKVRKAAGSSSISQTLRKARKMEREVGPLRFEYHADDPAAFNALAQWKDNQHQRTGRLRIFQYDWLVELLRNLAATDDSAHPGVFSTLYAGDTLVAVHLGLRSESVIHMWFPAYNVELENYSPGLVLLLKLAEEAARRGIQRIDLGRGSERYKANFKTGEIPIAEGAVDLCPVCGRLRKGWYSTKQWIRASPWRNQLERPLEASRRIRQWIAFD